MSRKVGINIEPGTMLWIPEPKGSKKVYTIAKILAADEFTATVRTEDEIRLETINISENPPFLVNPTVEADMTGLHYIHEPGILYNMGQRSLKSEPYTFMGSVLVAVNPLRRIVNPTNCGTKHVLTGPPHPYAVAESSFQQMTFQGVRELITNTSLKKANQSIVIGGESGAGKTESSKLVLEHLVNRLRGSSGSMNGLDARLLGTNPILEAFGNATTLRNPNSSRFGKMLRLHFDPPTNGAKGTDEDWGLRGATVQSYLLERSRVTTHEQGERGYHIMYYTIIGCNKKMHPSFDGLALEGGAGAFRYTTPVHPKYNDDHDSPFVLELISAFQAVGISGEELTSIFQIVAGVITIGNIQFEEKDTTEGACAFVSTAKELKSAASLLGVDETLLAKTFTERKFAVAGKEMVTARNAKTAGFARDAIAKAVYSGLFDWIMRKIDQALLAGQELNPDKTASIGVLDIFGFETFQINGFEQLLINYTNESLQGTFNSQIFIAEAALYQKEGLFGTNDYMGTPLDNGICIDLLQGDNKNPGILMTIDSESKVPDPTDAKLLQRIHTNFVTHPCMVKPHQKDKSTTFIVRHYAATVIYTIGTFLEKNNDRLPDDMESTLRSSVKATVRDVFTTNEAPPVLDKNGKPARKPPARTIVHKFQGQIKGLIDDLESTKCSFIRCIKPNAAMIRDDSNPSWFDERYVKTQLDALNIAQTAEVLRNGFPTRIEYSTLVDQYSKLLPPTALVSWKKTSDNRAFVKALFYAFGINNDDFKLGFTRVFFKGGKLAELNNVLKATTLNPDIVKKFSFYLIRIQWRKAYAYVCGELGFKKLYSLVRKKQLLAVKVQALYRMKVERKKFMELSRGARMAQKLFRGKQGRKKFAARRIQTQEELKKKIEEAKSRKDAEALAKAEKEAKDVRDAEERRKLEAEQQAVNIEAALQKQKEEIEEANEILAERRKTIAANKASKTRMTSMGTGNFNLRISPGGPLRTAMLAPPPPPPKLAALHETEDDMELPPPPPVFQSATKKKKRHDDDDAPPPPPYELEKGESDKKLLRQSSAKRGSFFEFIADKQEKDFRIPCSGYAFLKEENPYDSRKPTLFTRLLKRDKWIRMYYVLDKPGQMITIYTDFDKKQLIKEIKFNRDWKVWKYQMDRRKPFAVELDPGRTVVSYFFAFETENLWRRWMKDLDEAIVGFRPTVPTEKEIEKNDIKIEEVDLKVIAQLNFLLFRNLITQSEFNDLVQRAAANRKLELEVKEDPFSDDDKIYPLVRVISKDLAYSEGRLSFGDMRINRLLDFNTFDEVLSLCCDCRFALDSDPQKEIGWTIDRPFQDYRDMYSLLADPDGPISADVRDTLPNFPHFAFTNAAKFSNQATRDALARNIEEYLKKLLSLVPKLEEDLYLDELPPPPPALDPSKDPANWSRARDAETGEIFYHNKVTGETVNEDPTGLSKTDEDDTLPPDWEEAWDEGQKYYYNVVTDETTWEHPGMVKKPKTIELKKFEMKDLFRIPAINEFFDVKGNVEPFLAMTAM